MNTIRQLMLKVREYPKYLALTGMLFSAILPAALATPRTESVQAEKPAMLAIADMNLSALPEDTEKGVEMIIVQGNILLSQIASPDPLKCDVKETPKTLAENESIDSQVLGVRTADSNAKKVIVTAYSSTPDQTDDSPFITAMGTQVRDGIIACNFLKFGTKVRLPEIYGDKIFVVEDRMALKNSHKVDIWMPSRQSALQFGVKTLAIEVVE
ncbi:MAG: hypothetical protein PHQ47_02320 [Candidatus Portnoybacteria bacterium]|nr:hypothetical protein [Candidatus Portnoybacteria bacterium]